MIKVHIVRDDNSFIQEYTVKGHAGFAPHGSDIVCAAVSALAYTGAGALAQLVNINSYEEKDGFMKCTVPKGIDGEKRYKVQIILETIVVGFKQIEEAYKDYVVVLDEEV
ncbi:MAG: ribosomal-processing cysteine protease Prp [Acetivibrionales bacterium]|jgi:uncharacterized protein YsxB (DUF464 family)